MGNCKGKYQIKFSDLDRERVEWIGDQCYIPIKLTSQVKGLLKKHFENADESEPVDLYATLLDDGVVCLYNLNYEDDTVEVKELIQTPLLDLYIQMIASESIYDSPQVFSKHMAGAMEVYYSMYPAGGETQTLQVHTATSFIESEIEVRRSDVFLSTALWLIEQTPEFGEVAAILEKRLKTILESKYSQNKAASKRPVRYDLEALKVIGPSLERNNFMVLDKEREYLTVRAPDGSKLEVSVKLLG